jgi:general L-amino acid transport system substrate-binding protein
MNKETALDLNGVKACADRTTSELNLADYFRVNNMKYGVIAFADTRGGDQGI